MLEQKVSRCMNSERTKDFIHRAYANALSKGFHDERYSHWHYLMLVISEVGEMLNADRSGRRADLGLFNDALRSKSFDSCFESYVKDTVEDEMSDVCIRLYDMCGALGIRPYENFSLMMDEYDDIIESECLSFCESCFTLCAILCRSENGSLEFDGTLDCVPVVVESALSFVYCMAYDMNIDLVRHIELKMHYNEGRSVRHGKRY